MRLIDADALMKDLEKWMKQVDPTHPQEDNAIPPLDDIVISTMMTIEEQPTIEERKKGKWIHDGYDFPGGNDWIHCSECGKRGINVPADLTNYCSKCGADMRESNKLLNNS